MEVGRSKMNVGSVAQFWVTSLFGKDYVPETPGSHCHFLLVGVAKNRVTSQQMKPQLGSFGSHRRFISMTLRGNEILRLVAPFTGSAGSNPAFLVSFSSRHHLLGSVAANRVTSCLRKRFESFGFFLKEKELAPIGEGQDQILGSNGSRYHLLVRALRRSGLLLTQYQTMQFDSAEKQGASPLPVSLSSRSDFLFGAAHG